MRTFGIVVMLSTLLRLCTGSGCRIVRSSASCIASRRRLCLHRRLSPPSLSTMTACFHSNSLTFRFTTANAFEEFEQSRLRPMPKVTRRRVSSAAAFSAFVGDDCNDDEDEGTTIQNNRARMFPRAAYQIYPIRPGSSRPMPPSVSDYYSTKNKYNTDESVDASGDDVTNDDYPSDVYDSLSDPIEGSSTSKSFRIIQPQQLQGPSMLSNEVEIIPSSDSSQDMSTLSEQTIPSENVIIANAYSYKRIVPRVTPSFMEPIKSKAMGGETPVNGSLNSDSFLRDIPAEASNGSSSTSHLTTLSRQLEHLTLQIYHLNNGVEFNINSPKQVARVLFGDVDYDTGTNKDVLEAMASAGNEMA
jgi:hypothetical protein